MESRSLDMSTLQTPLHVQFFFGFTCIVTSVASRCPVPQDTDPSTMNYHLKSANEEPMSTTMLCKVTASHIKLDLKHLYKSIAMCGRLSLLEQLAKKWVSMQVSNIPSIQGDPVSQLQMKQCPGRTGIYCDGGRLVL